MGDFSLTSNVQELIDALTAAATTLPEMVQPWNSLIIAETEVKERELYGAKLAALWVTQEVAPGEGQLAHISTGTDSPFMMGAEFGTRPHDIWAHHIALRFEKNGELLYRQMVHHPGTAGKRLSNTLEADIELSARTNWTEALTTIIDNLQNELP